MKEEVLIKRMGNLTDMILAVSSKMKANSLKRMKTIRARLLAKMKLEKRKYLLFNQVIF